MTVTEIVSLTKDIVVILAAIVGGKVAVKGLSTWQRQLRGTNEHDLARNILVKVYRYRDAVHGVRHPAMFGYEMPDPEKETIDEMTWEEKRFYGTSKAYEARWEKVQEEKKSLYGDLLEAEAYWGNELEDHFKELYKLETDLLLVLQELLTARDPHSSPDDKDYANEYLKEKRGLIYDKLEGEPDEFRKSILDAIVKIEDILKPRLKGDKT